MNPGQETDAPRGTQTQTTKDILRRKDPSIPQKRSRQFRQTWKFKCETAFHPKECLSMSEKCQYIVHNKRTGEIFVNLYKQRYRNWLASHPFIVSDTLRPWKVPKSFSNLKGLPVAEFEILHADNDVVTIQQEKLAKKAKNLIPCFFENEEDPLFDNEVKGENHQAKFEGLLLGSSVKAMVIHLVRDVAKNRKLQEKLAQDILVIQEKLAHILAMQEKLAQDILAMQEKKRQ